MTDHKHAEGTAVPSTTTDWSRSAKLRRETEQAITRAEEATKRLERALNDK
jgi:hypothetical protein